MRYILVLLSLGGLKKEKEVHRLGCWSLLQVVSVASFITWGLFTARGYLWDWYRLDYEPERLGSRSSLRFQYRKVPDPSAPERLPFSDRFSSFLREALERRPHPRR